MHSEIVGLCHRDSMEAKNINDLIEKLDKFEKNWSSEAIKHNSYDATCGAGRALSAGCWRLRGYSWEQCSCVSPVCSAPSQWTSTFGQIWSQDARIDGSLLLTSWWFLLEAEWGPPPGGCVLPGGLGLEWAAPWGWIYSAIEWAGTWTLAQCDNTSTLLSPGLQAAAGNLEFFADNEQEAVMEWWKLPTVGATLGEELYPLPSQLVECWGGVSWFGGGFFYL